MNPVKHVTTVFTPRRLLLLATVLLLCGFSLVVYGIGTALTVSPATLNKQLGSHAGPIVVDVRFSFEFEEGHIPGAINLPLPTLMLRHEDLALSRDKPLVVYCGHGPRACLASFVLKMVGFAHVYVLEGQIKAWQNAGFPLTL